jgi:hypothetical protein
VLRRQWAWPIPRGRFYDPCAGKCIGRGITQRRVFASGEQLNLATAGVGPHNWHGLPPLLTFSVWPWLIMGAGRNRLDR